MLLRLSTLAACLLALAGVGPSQARACGGFFCDNAQPVNQAAERIIFARNDDGTTDAIIQIQYSGPSEDFAWMLPVQGSPEISVSSNIAFSALQRATNPNYQLNTVVEGQCYEPRSELDFAGGGGGLDASASFDAGAAADMSAPPVNVVDSGSVGPFDFVIIAVEPDTENIAAVATDWLNENGYDVSELGRDRLVPYLESGMNLLAFRLTKGRDAGEIRPVRLSFGEGLPSIPLRPTAAAATPDMGIMVWVLGESRSIPANYLHLELNEAAINWFNPASTYNDVVTQAANEAGGQGFVTEFSGGAAPFEETIYPSFWDAQLEGWREPGTPHGRLIVDIASSLSGWDGLTGAILAEVPKPDGVSEEAWAASPLDFLFDLQFVDEIEGFDASSFVARVEDDVLAPVRDTAALFTSGLTATRFYTTMSPDEMTMDPVFDFNAELPALSNVHVQTRIIECAPSVTFQEAPWRVEFEDGTIVRGGGNTWPIRLDTALPANRRVIRIGTTGTGSVITDNSASIERIIEESNRNFPPPPPGPHPSAAERDGAAAIGGGACAAGGSAGSALALLLLGFVVRRRR